MDRLSTTVSAVVTIQRWYRGVRGRRQAHEKKLWKAFKAIDMDEEYELVQSIKADRDLAYGVDQMKVVRRSKSIESISSEDSAGSLDRLSGGMLSSGVDTHGTGMGTLLNPHLRINIDGDDADQGDGISIIINKMKELDIQHTLVADKKPAVLTHDDMYTISTAADSSSGGTDVHKSNNECASVTIQVRTFIGRCMHTCM